MDSNPNKDLARFGGMEFSTFRLRAGVTEEALMAAAQRAREGLMQQQEGFLGHAVLKRESDSAASVDAEPVIWVDVLWTQTPAQAQAICQMWITNPDCADYLALIEPGSAQLGFFSRQL